MTHSTSSSRHAGRAPVLLDSAGLRAAVIGSFTKLAPQHAFKKPVMAVVWLGTLLTAGLFHDVGELYVDPAYLDAGTRLDPLRWKHIVAHPVSGYRVLRDMEGAGRRVADAVFQHHDQSR